jgi:hypothetical protein
MSPAAQLATIPGHLHWCPRCDTTWSCAHGLVDCPLDGSVVVEDHCAQPAPWDDEAD